MHNTSWLLENIRLSFSSTSSIFNFLCNTNFPVFVDGIKCIILWMVWEKGSSMYNSLIVARPTFSVEVNRLGLLAEPMPSLDAISMHINASCGGLPPVPSLQKHESSPGSALFCYKANVIIECRHSFLLAHAIFSVNHFQARMEIFGHQRECALIIEVCWWNGILLRPL